MQTKSNKNTDKFFHNFIFYAQLHFVKLFVDVQYIRKAIMHFLCRRFKLQTTNSDNARVCLQITSAIYIMVLQIYRYLVIIQTYVTKLLYCKDNLQFKNPL